MKARVNTLTTNLIPIQATSITVSVSNEKQFEIQYYCSAIKKYSLVNIISRIFIQGGLLPGAFPICGTLSDL
jgi:hypothetical protein